ncbi:nickel-binding protein [Spongiimicrobium sp. 2-473A-2-J]|uniref:nickel-binding protein n=1 Tax=Eudoraea algarum TaxID=3417568 RepID=UPI003D36B7F5
MPIFMDRHIVPGIEAKNAAEAHREDLRVQDKFGCRCMTYWVDEERGNAFCLIDAPNKEAVEKMHNSAHGLIPHEILQVNSNVVEAFLGRIQDPEAYYSPEDPDLKVFNDPAFRIILVTETMDMGLLSHKMGKEKAQHLTALYHEIMRAQLHQYEGREVELKGQGFIASFVSVTQAVSCAVAVMKGLHVAGELIGLRMGLNAGMPVSKSPELFGDTVNMARYLCKLGGENQIVMASIIREIYKDDGPQGISQHQQLKCIGPSDENFLQLLMETLFKNWSDPQFGVGEFCEQMSMSKSKLYRKSTELTGKSPNELLREYRLQKSLALMRTDRNIAQTTFDSGFSSPSYFTKCFQERFGLQPMAYRKHFT